MQFGETIPELEWIQPGLIIYQGYKTKLTPMFEQYLDAKKQNPSALLLFRMGDFYETFFKDAKLLSQACDLTLTSRNKGEDGEEIPMAGVPFRSINEYLFQLVEQGFRVAICDQLEDPAQAVGIVRRGITQIVTPGTLCDDRPGFDKNARFLTSLVWHDMSRLKTTKKAENAGNAPLCAIASIDMSTGYCTMTELQSIQALQSELLRLNVRELISHHTAQDESLENVLRGIPIAYRERETFAQQSLLDHWMDEESGNFVFMSKEKFLSFIDLIDQAHFDTPSLVAEAFCGLLVYLRDLHYPLTDNIQQIYPYRAESYMQIDAATFQNLEIYATLRGNQKNGSLLGELDDTVTAPGSRLLQNWLAYPLKDIRQIRARHDAVEELTGNYECLTVATVITHKVFESYMIGTFFLLYLACLLALAFACKNSRNKGLIHLIYLGLIIFADVFIIVWEYRTGHNGGNILKRLRKVAGYFLFVASIALWYSGVGRFINEIFQKNMIPLVESPVS